MGIETGQDFTMDGNIPKGPQTSSEVEIPAADISPDLPAGMGAVYRARAENRARQAAETNPKPERLSQEQQILSVRGVRRTLFVGNSRRGQ